MDRTKRINRIYLIISIIILAISAVLTAFVYRPALYRLLECCRDFGKTMAFYFVSVFGFLWTDFGKAVPVISPPAGAAPSFAPYMEYIDISLEQIFGVVVSTFTKLLELFNFLDFNAWLLDKTVYLIFYLSLVLLFGCVFAIVVDDYNSDDREDSLGETSAAYRIMLKILSGIKAAFKFVCSGVRWFRSKWYLLLPFITVWIINFGLACFVLDFFAFYFYLLSSMEFVSFLYFLQRLVLNLLITVRSVPLWVFLVFFALMYHWYHRRHALDTLRHNEAKNCGLLKELDLILYIIGGPGKGKTTFMTDVVLSLVNIYKQESLDILYKIEMYFPGFDFSSFRAALADKVSAGEIFCMPNIDDYVNTLFEAYAQSSNSSALYGYDDKLFGNTVNLGNIVLDLKTALIIYGRAFLIYQNNNPTVANYSIRFDGTFDNSDYLKLWDGDFFKKSRAKSYYSHILVQNKMISNGQNTVRH